MTAAMILSSSSVAFATEDANPAEAVNVPAEATSAAGGMFADTNGHWAAPAIDRWAGFGVLKGSEGKFRPNDSITRAEMATVLDNMMGYQAAAENTFSDVSDGAWYEAAVLRANAAGILNGDGAGHASPCAKITREQAALMLARAFAVDKDLGAGTKFSDEASISSWAKSLVFGMEKAGYVSGYNGKFNPRSSITRAEVVTIINNAVKAYYDKAGVYTEDSPGLAIVKAPDVTIKSATINGDLIVAEGTADGSLVLDGVKITGDLIIKGDCLRPFTLLGSIDGGKMNLVDVDPDAAVYSVSGKDGFTYATGGISSSKDLAGSFVALWDTNHDQKADRIVSVPRSISERYWDPEMFWLTGAGESTSPSVTDAIGEEVFSKDNVIPMGERLLTGYGLGDYSGTTDFSNLADPTYWPMIDYYHTTTGDTLTMLTGYKTILQATEGTCGPASALTVLEWYGERGDLNEEDLSGLRKPQPSWGGFTSLKALTGIFNNLGDLGITDKWELYSSFDDSQKLYDPAWIKDNLTAGHPILVGWNSFGGHWQVIIGYDTMGTEGTNDDVLILADPYDTTDHNQDGYVLESFERLVYGWTAAFDEDYALVVAFPEKGNADVIKALGLEKPYFTPKATGTDVD